MRRVGEGEGALRYNYIFCLNALLNKWPKESLYVIKNLLGSPIKCSLLQANNFFHSSRLYPTFPLWLNIDSCLQVSVTHL